MKVFDPISCVCSYVMSVVCDLYSKNPPRPPPLSRLFYTTVSQKIELLQQKRLTIDKTLSNWGVGK